MIGLAFYSVMVVSSSAAMHFVKGSTTMRQITEGCLINVGKFRRPRAQKKLKDTKFSSVNISFWIFLFMRGCWVHCTVTHLLLDRHFDSVPCVILYCPHADMHWQSLSSVHFVDLSMVTVSAQLRRPRLVASKTDLEWEMASCSTQLYLLVNF